MKIISNCGQNSKTGVEFSTPKSRAAATSVTQICVQSEAINRLQKHPQDWQILEMQAEYYTVQGTEKPNHTETLGVCKNLWD